MTTIKKPDWKDLLRIPAFDLGEDGKIIIPSIGENLSAWSHYSLVAEAPGKHIMGFLCGSLQIDENTHQIVASIDKCRGNKLYEKMEPMEGLISEFEKVLCWEKVVSHVKVVSGNETNQMYKRLGYRNFRTMRHEGGQELFDMTKTIWEAEEAAVQEAAAAEQKAAAVQKAADLEILAKASLKAATIVQAGQAAAQEAAQEAARLSLLEVEPGRMRMSRRRRSMMREEASTDAEESTSAPSRPSF